MASACWALSECWAARSGSCGSTCNAATACWSARKHRCKTGPDARKEKFPMLKIVFLFLRAGGLPVAIAMAGASLIYLFWVQTTPLFVVIHRMIGGIDSFPLLAVSFFILAGTLRNNAGVTNRMFNFALALVGWLKCGLGHVNVLASVIFAGRSG